MNIVRFDPFRELEAFFGPVSAPRPSRSAPRAFTPRADVSESESAYRIELELPAVDREQVEVSVKEGVLTVSGKRAAADDGDWKVLRRERGAALDFSRSFRLPKDAQEDAIEASAANGVLTVLIRKAVEAAPRRIEVAVA